MQGVQNICGYLSSTTMAVALQTGALSVIIFTMDTLLLELVALLKKHVFQPLNLLLQPHF
jgi:hypothetical protein